MAPSSTDRPGARRWLGPALGAAAFLVAVLVARTSRVDIAAMASIARMRTPQLSSVCLAIYTLGDEGFAALVVAGALGVLAWNGRWRDATGFAVATGGILAWIDLVLKRVFARHRPSELIVKTTGSAFPSGHAAGNLVLYLCLAALAAERWPGAAPWFHRVAWGWIVLQALSCVYVGAHYPTDVVAGLGAGFLWWSVVRAWRARPTEHPSPPRTGSG